MPGCMVEEWVPSGFIRRRQWSELRAGGQGVGGLDWECLKELRKRKGSLGWCGQRRLNRDGRLEEKHTSNFLAAISLWILQNRKAVERRGFCSETECPCSVTYGLWPWAAHIVSLGLWNQFDNWDKIVFCSAWSWELIMYMKAANNVCMYVCMHVYVCTYNISFYNLSIAAWG